MVSTQSAAAAPGRRRGRPPRDPEDNSTPRGRILRAAESVIATHGVHSFRLSDVAAQLGVQVPSLYNHFASRDDLLLQLAAQLSDDFRKLEAAQHVPGGDAMENLRRGVRSFTAYLYERPAAARMFLWEASQGGAVVWMEILAIDARGHAAGRRRFERAVHNGAFRAIRYERFTAQLNGAIACQLLWGPYDRPPEPVSLETLQDEAEDFAVRLLTPDPAGA